MATCPKCGVSISTFQDVCSNCMKAILDKKKTAEAEKKQQAAEEYGLQREKLFKEKLKDLQDRVSRNERMFFYENITVDLYEDGFDSGELIRKGIVGWDVVAVLRKNPKIALTINADRAAAEQPEASLDLNPEEAHFLLKKEIVNGNITDKDLSEYLSLNIDRLL